MSIGPVSISHIINFGFKLMHISGLHCISEAIPVVNAALGKFMFLHISHASCVP